MERKSLVGCLGLLAALLCSPLAMGAAAATPSDTILKIDVRKKTFDPSEDVSVTIETKGYMRLLASFPSWMNVKPSRKADVTTSVVDGIAQFDIAHPNANLTLSMDVTLPETSGATYSFVVTGITPLGAMHKLKPYVITTGARQDRSAASESGQAMILPVAAATPAPALSTPAPSPTSLPASNGGGLFGKTRVQLGAAWLHEFDPYKDNDVALGYPRSFTNVNGSVMTQLADSQWDFGLAGGAYRSPSSISKNQELLASFGRSVLRVGPVLRYRSNKSNNTVLQAMVGVNTGDQIQGTSYFSTSAQWEQKIGNTLFRMLGIVNATGSVFPKRYALQNTLRGTLNGALESWSIQEQVDAPLPVFDAKGNVSPLALSAGLTWNAIWDKNGKLPKQFRGSLDVYPWLGVTYRFGPNNQSGVMAAGVKGDDYRDGGETPLGLLTTGTLVLEGGDRDIKNVDMSAFDEDEE